jgi:hypothetical protein
MPARDPPVARRHTRVSSEAAPPRPVSPGGARLRFARTACTPDRARFAIAHSRRPAHMHSRAGNDRASPRFPRSRAPCARRKRNPRARPSAPVARGAYAIPRVLLPFARCMREPLALRCACVRGAGARDRLLPALHAGAIARANARASCAIRSAARSRAHGAIPSPASARAHGARSRPRDPFRVPIASCAEPANP